MRAAQLGINVVFDFGFWGKDERSALRWIAGAVGARSQVVYLPIDPEDNAVVSPIGSQVRRIKRST